MNRTRILTIAFSICAGVILAMMFSKSHSLLPFNSASIKQEVYGVTFKFNPGDAIAKTIVWADPNGTEWWLIRNDPNSIEPEAEKLMTLGEWDEYVERILARLPETSTSGIACPECGEELQWNYDFDSSWNINCNHCDWTGIARIS